MRDLDFFQRRFAPVSTSICFVDIRIDDIVPFWLKQHRLQQKNLGWTVTLDEVHGSLEDKFTGLLPLNARKNLVTETADGGTAYFSNHPYTNTVEMEPSLWCETFKARQIWIVFDDVKPSDIVGGVQFNYSDYSSNPVRKRGVYVNKDRRWTFDQYFEPFPFEELESYGAKGIKDRLTPEMVERYCQQFGIEPFDPEFYKGKGHILSLRPYPGFPELDKYPNQ
jgi:hypothetical protein